MASEYDRDVPGDDRLSAGDPACCYVSLRVVAEGGSPRAALPSSLVVHRRKAAFELRHPSWSEPAVLTALRDRGCALCIADTDEEPATRFDATAEWGYLRLRRESYDADALAAWAECIARQPWNVAYVFFKHETAEGLRLWRPASSRCSGPGAEGR
jgi:hypothetical protein